MTLPIRRSLISSVIQNQMIERQSPEETKCHKVMRRFLEGLSVLVSCGGKVPFYAINQKLAGDNRALQILCPYGNLTSFAILESWALLNIVEEEMGPFSKEEKKLLSSQINKLQRIAILINYIFWGIISVVPLAYLAYAYNDGNLLMPIMMLVSDSGPPMYSVKLSLEKILREGTCLQSIEKKLLEVRGEITRRLEGKMQELSLDSDEHIKELQRILQELEGDARWKKYVEHILSLQDQVKEEGAGIAAKVVDGGAMIMGSFLVVIQMYILGLMGYKGTKLLLNSKEDGYVGGGIVVAANLLLNGRLIVNMTRYVMGLGLPLFKGEYQKPLGEQIHPKMGFFLKAFALFTVGFSWGPSFQVPKDYQKDLPDNTVPYFQMGLILATIFMVLPPMFMIGEQIVHQIIKGSASFSEEATGKVIHHAELKRLGHVIDKTTLEHFGEFLLDLPESITKPLLEKVGVTREEIQGYVRECRRKAPGDLGVPINPPV